MTHKHYNAFAEELKLFGQSETTDRYTFMGAVNAIATVLGRDNPRFNAETFRNACGYYREEEF